MYKTARIIICFAILLLGSTVGRATTVERLTLDDLVKKARSIVVGKVTGTRTFWSDNGKLILTSITIDVQETIKGFPSRTVELTTIGGTLNGLTLHVAGMPSFEKGENAVIFIENAGAFSTVVGLGQGKFSVENGEVTNTVTDLQFTDGKAGRALKLPLNDFKKEIKERIQRLP